jgi:16S rRNA (uracil1498-N3)-methyltransferase
VSLPHFFAGAPEPGETVVLEAEDAHHALRSLRLREGDELTSSDGAGALVRCRVVTARHLLVEAEVLERTFEPRPLPEVSVLLAPPKGERLSWAVQKLTETGVDAVVLVDAPRSVRRWTGDRGTRAVERLGAVAREAAKQSRRRTIPRILGPRPWEEALRDALEEGAAVLLWEGAGAGLLSLLPEEAPARVTLVVGPEGGIPQEDAIRAEKMGVLVASLGPNILRTETAAMVAAAVTLARYGRLG